MKKAYVSRLALYLEAFVEFKHSLGWKYETSKFYLYEFDQYCADNESESFSLPRWPLENPPVVARSKSYLPGGYRQT